jgi:hypothetical protein
MAPILMVLGWSAADLVVVLLSLEQAAVASSAPTTAMPSPMPIRGFIVTASLT